MKVFISWSGERSRQVAALLYEWIQCVNQKVLPWMSSIDIDGGTIWFSEISDQLATTSIGIVCLTKENKTKPWILFEAGALAKGLTSSRVMTFLIDLETKDIGDPLAQFNHTTPVKDSLRKVVVSINKILPTEDQIKEPLFTKIFETYWPEFERTFKNIIDNTPETEDLVKRDDGDLLNDIYNAVRNLTSRMNSLESGSKSVDNNRSYLGPTKKFTHEYISTYSKKKRELGLVLSENYKNSPERSNVDYTAFESFIIGCATGLPTLDASIISIGEKIIVEVTFARHSSFREFQDRLAKTDIFVVAYDLPIE